MVYLIICAVLVNSIIEFCLILDFAYPQWITVTGVCASLHADAINDNAFVWIFHIFRSEKRSIHSQWTHLRRGAAALGPFDIPCEMNQNFDSEMEKRKQTNRATWIRIQIWALLWPNDFEFGRKIWSVGRIERNNRHRIPKTKHKHQVLIAINVCNCILLSW